MSPFIIEQADEMDKLGINVIYFGIKGKGVFGYLKNYFKLYKTVLHENVDIVHAHYGLSGLLAILQRKVPVVITFHGSDIYDKRVRFFHE